MSFTQERFVGLTRQDWRPFLQEPLQVEYQSILIPDLPPELGRLKIAQLSDFHYDRTRLNEPLLEAAIAASNAAEP
ncbi:MAG: hypothetical protein ACPGVO_16000, partial [Spirulinaceae cyanobacterium]